MQKVLRSLIKPGQRWTETISFGVSVGEIISVEGQFVSIQCLVKGGYFNYKGQILKLIFYCPEWKSFPNQDKQ